MKEKFLFEDVAKAQGGTDRQLEMCLELKETEWM